MGAAVRTVYHITDGPTTMYQIDANHAVRKFPKEWSDKEWSDKAKAAAAKSAETGAKP